MPPRSTPKAPPTPTVHPPAPPDRTLKSRNFSAFFAARAAARLGDSMAPVALAAGLVAYGYGAGAVGLAMASMTACFAGFVVFGGVIADRFEPRALMVGADLARVVSQSMMAALFLTGHVVLWQLCALGAVAGTGAALFQPGVASTIPRIVDDVQGANGAVRTAESVMTLAGPAAAGVLIGFTSPGGVYVVHAATFAASAACLGLLRLPPAPAQGRVKESFRTDLIEGWREFRSRTWLWGVITVWMGLMIGASGPSVPLIATDVVRAHGAGAYGVVNSAMGAGMALAGLLAMRTRPARPLRAGSLALLGWFVMPLSVGLGLPVWAMAVALAVGGGATAFWGVMWATSIQTQIPRRVLSRVHAYEVAGSVAMFPVGQALAGPAAELFGLRHVLVVNAAVGLAAAVALLSVPAIRGLRRAEG